MSLEYRRPLARAAVALALCSATALASAQTASNSATERFTAAAVNNSIVGRPGVTPLDITINRWSSEAERDKLTTAFKEKGPEALLSALQDTKPVGTISTPGNVGYDLRYARELPGEDGGRRIILATDRPMSFWEVANQPRSKDYPFLLIELRLNKNGEGEGKLSPASRLSLNDNTLVIENYANQPVALNQVKPRK